MGCGLPTAGHWENLLFQRFHTPKRNRNHTPSDGLPLSLETGAFSGDQTSTLLLLPTKHRRNLGGLFKKRGPHQKFRRRWIKLWMSNLKALEMEETRPLRQRPFSLEKGVPRQRSYCLQKAPDILCSTLPL